MLTAHVGDNVCLPSELKMEKKRRVGVGVRVGVERGKAQVEDGDEAAAASP